MSREPDKLAEIAWFLLDAPPQLLTLAAGQAIGALAEP
jgi:hypothetical protein